MPLSTQKGRRRSKLCHMHISLAERSGERPGPLPLAYQANKDGKETPLDRWLTASQAAIGTGVYQTTERLSSESVAHRTSFDPSGQELVAVAPLLGRELGSFPSVYAS